MTHVQHRIIRCYQDEDTTHSSSQHLATARVMIPLIFVVFLTDILANLHLELVYSQLEQFGQGGGGWCREIAGLSPVLVSRVLKKHIFFSRLLVKITRKYCVEHRSPHDWEVISSASDRQGSNFESCIWIAVWSYSSHHSQRGDLALQIGH